MNIQKSLEITEKALEIRHVSIRLHRINEDLHRHQETPTFRAADNGVLMHYDGGEMMSCKSKEDAERLAEEMNTTFRVQGKAVVKGLVETLENATGLLVNALPSSEELEHGSL